MRVEFIQSIDFNQMLVYSTFIHLLFLTIVMFLPSPKVQQQLVVPTFRLDLIELPATVKSGPTPGKKKEVATPPVKKTPVAKTKRIAKKLKNRKVKTLIMKPKAKQSLPPMPVIEKPVVKKLLPLKPTIKESTTRKKILADLEAFESSAPKQSILKELDEIARIVPEVPVKKVVPPKPMQERTFKEIEREKELELPLKLEQTKIPSLVESSEVEAKERELTELLKESKQIARFSLPNRVKKVEPPKQIKSSETTAYDLIKELEALEKKKLFPANVPIEKEHSEGLDSIPVSKDLKDKTLVSVAKKFKELEESPEEIKMDISQNRMVRREFKTVIRRGETITSEMDSELETSNVLSNYVGKVYKRVYSNWKTPLGSKVKKVIVAFTVFRKGNIDQPVIRESAGDENLDSIAVRAVSDSVPFPPLPEELRRPNLRINIVFKYVPEEN